MPIQEPTTRRAATALLPFRALKERGGRLWLLGAVPTQYFAGIKKTVLKFKLLIDLATYVKKTRIDSYVIDTSKITLFAFLTEVQIAIAIEEYHAVLLPLTEKV